MEGKKKERKQVSQGKEARKRRKKAKKDRKERKKYVFSQMMPERKFRKKKPVQKRTNGTYLYM